MVVLMHLVLTVILFSLIKAMLMGHPSHPLYVGSDYYCETGFNSPGLSDGFYSNDPVGWAAV